MTAPESAPGGLVHLRSAGVSVVLDSRRAGLPALLWWGADLGRLTGCELSALAEASAAPVGDSRIDVPEHVSILPTPAEGWVGIPGLIGSRAGTDFSPLFALVDQTPIAADETVADGRSYRGVDEVAGLELGIDVTLTHSGLLELRATLTNTHPLADYQLEGLVIALPVPAEADELLDLTGRHTRERAPQRGPFNVGVHLRESRQGRPGLDSPYILMAGAAGFGFGSGQVWGLHTGWSGNQRAYAERLYNGQRHLGGGELLLSGEVRLAPGRSYRTPALYASYGNGLNEMSGRFHRYLRSRPGHPRKPRPVLINTWEAVYFDQTLENLTALARVGAAVGAERFVLDDGWFRNRRNDHAGLGDWYVDDGVWPDGLGPLIDTVHELGMDFGLWFEPEMINLDSDLARAHPDWIFTAGGRDGIPTRQQYVLDLGHPEAYAYIAGRLHEVLDTYDIAYIKWDHNRMVVEAGHSPSGSPGVHNHTAAVYRLLDELRERHPELEIESCAGGGGRIDLGILQHTDRVWASDCIDALERQQIQRYTQLLLPPELIGTHLGGPTAHTTHRSHHLEFRAATAIWGHMGIEWNLTSATPDELAKVGRWVELYKQIRELLHSGSVIVADHPDPAIWVNGVVGLDQSEAVFGIASVGRSTTWPPGRVRLPGLDPDRLYQVAPLAPADTFEWANQLPAWWKGGLTLSGRVLAEVGVQIPAMLPEHLHVIGATALAEDTNSS